MQLRFHSDKAESKQIEPTVCEVHKDSEELPLDAYPNAVSARLYSLPRQRRIDAKWQPKTIAGRLSESWNALIADSPWPAMRAWDALRSYRPDPRRRRYILLREFLRDCVPD